MHLVYTGMAWLLLLVVSCESPKESKPTGSPAWKTDLINGDHFMGGSSSPAAISGYPSITVPMGFINELPVGVSFFGRAWSEPILLEIAYSYEQNTRHRKAPRYIPSR